MELSRLKRHVFQDSGSPIRRLSRIHRGSHSDRPHFRRSHVLEGHVRAVPAVLPQPAQIDCLLKPFLLRHSQVGQPRPSLRHQRRRPHHRLYLRPQPRLHPQRPDPVARFGNRNPQAPQIGQGVGLDLLHAGCKHIRSLPASPSPVGRVGVIEPHLPLPPVGQRQLRGEKGLLLTCRRQNHRNEQRPRGQPEAPLLRVPAAAVIDEGARSRLGEGKHHFTGTPVIVGQSHRPHAGTSLLIRCSCPIGRRRPRPGWRLALRPTRSARTGCPRRTAAQGFRRSPPHPPAARSAASP